MWEIVWDALADSVRMLPFLFVTYLAMEYLEHKTSDKTTKVIERAGKFGPFFGALLGLLPQCGFSAAASSLYAGRVITIGTLSAVFLSTSDEMLPILISEAVPLSLIVTILACKFILALFFGFAIDFGKRFLRRKANRPLREPIRIHEVCEEEHCNCGGGILRSALRHTLQIFSFLLIVNLLLGAVIEGIGEDGLSGLILNRPLLGEMLAALIGLIPNCAASVAITKLYLSGAMSGGALMAGLLSGSGVGMLVLFRTNRNLKRNLTILALVCGAAVFGGLLVGGLGILG